MNRRTVPQERVKFWRDSALRGLEMLHATYITYAFARHAHEGFGIAIVESGAMEFDYRGASHIAPAGSVVITQPGEMHTGQAVLETGWTYRTLLPATDWLQQAAAELSERSGTIPYFSSPVIHDRCLNQQLISLHRVLETSPSSLERESRFLWEMAQLIHGYASNRPITKAVGQENNAVQQVRDYLTSHYTCNISLDELATLVNLSPFRLLRVFRKQVGLPPHAYLNHVRVQRAKRLLATGHPIAETALATGFADQSHLHRHFKKMLGVTPGQYVRGCH
ncbi:family transcriptional regulator [Leptolyngbya sp. Heron Island J]|uniref:AraC family transcriptional regulator n=1 Tax=Leptolyngbya sp. Heron Island J TaxID=1385935 RepID=UPI0003B998A5|nr:AraC family transcriptional regulator [Leptolyngbya sp. Heron Island J]ESA34773.1 family transcriptional regulator [Leptolyngbya sp. Heron Island J]